MANGPFFQSMQPASFGGVTFYVVAGRMRFGRRNATHEYPFRDTVWVEDLGRQARRIQLSGFLVGDDVVAQLKALMSAAESSTPSELVHPILGRVQVALMDCDAGDSMDAGRVVELLLSFVQQGQRQYPADSASSAAGTQASANSATTATSSSWQQTGGPALTGPSSNNALASASTDFSAQSALAAQNATALVRMAAVLLASQGSPTRYGTGILIGQTVVGAPTDVQGLIGLAAAGRQNVSQANDSLIDTANSVQQTNAADFATAVAAVCEAVRVSAATPGDAVDALALLAAFTTQADEAGDALTAHLAAADLMARMAAVSMVRAAALYRPETQADALALRDQVVAVLDMLILDAGDAGDDTAYQAIRSLRASFVSQINALGVSLPELVPFTLGESIPVLVLAQRLYKDASRADELVARSAAVNPDFVPPSTFLVLSA